MPLIDAFVASHVLVMLVPSLVYGTGGTRQLESASTQVAFVIAGADEQRGDGACRAVWSIGSELRHYDDTVILITDGPR